MPQDVKKKKEKKERLRERGGGGRELEHFILQGL